MPYHFDDYENTPKAQQSIGTVALRDYLIDEFKRFDIDYQKRARTWSQWHEQFRGVVSKSANQIGKSRLFINRTRVAVRSGLANILDVLFPGQDFYDVVGRTDMDQQGSEISKQLMDWILQVGAYIPEAAAYVLQAAIYGTTFGKIVRREVTDVVMMQEPVMHPLLLQPTGYKRREVRKTLTYTALEMVDIFSMRIDPEGTSIENASGLFHDTERTMEYLRTMEKRGIYSNIDDVEKLVQGKGVPRNDKDKRRKNIGLPEDGIKHKGNVRLSEYWGKIPAEIARKADIEVRAGEFEVEIIATLVGSGAGNPEILIRQERNTNPAQERMFVSDVWEPSGDNSLYGVGIAENARGSQLALNATINMRLDNKAWAIAQPVIVDLGKIEAVDDLIARPNWIIRTHGSPNDVVKFASIPDVTATAYIEAQEFERHIDDESGMNKVVQASEGFGSNRTRGGISLAYSAASRPVRLIARGFEQNLIAKGLKKIFMLFVTDMDKEVVIRVTKNPKAPQFLTVDPFSLALDVDFIPSGSFALTQREQMLEALETFMDGMSKVLPVLNPAIDGRPNMGYFAEKFYQSLGLKDWDKAWIKPQVAGTQAQQQQQQQAVMAAAAKGGANAGQAQPQANRGTTPAGSPQGANILSILANAGRMG